jgi:hypothetical protein
VAFDAAVQDVALTARVLFQSLQLGSPRHAAAHRESAGANQ